MSVQLFPLLISSSNSKNKNHICLKSKTMDHTASTVLKSIQSSMIMDGLKRRNYLYPILNRSYRVMSFDSNSGNNNNNNSGHHHHRDHHHQRVGLSSEFCSTTASSSTSSTSPSSLLPQDSENIDEEKIYSTPMPSVAAATAITASTSANTDITGSQQIQSPFTTDTTEAATAAISRSQSATHLIDSRRFSSVRRRLFSTESSTVDSTSCDWIKLQTAETQREQSEKYNFDFARGCPLPEKKNDRFRWEPFVQHTETKLQKSIESSSSSSVSSSTLPLSSIPSTSKSTITSDSTGVDSGGDDNIQVANPSLTKQQQQQASLMSMLQVRCKARSIPTWTTTTATSSLKSKNIGAKNDDDNIDKPVTTISTTTSTTPSKKRKRSIIQSSKEELKKIHKTTKRLRKCVETHRSPFECSKTKDVPCSTTSDVVEAPSSFALKREELTIIDTSQTSSPSPQSSSSSSSSTTTTITSSSSSSTASLSDDKRAN